MVRLSRTLAAGIAAATLAAAPPFAVALHDSVELHISEATLDQALLALGRQAGVSIVFATDATSDLPAPTVEGRHSLESALAVLLAGACLGYQHVDEDLIAILPGCGNPIVTDTARRPFTRPTGGTPAPPPMVEIVVREQYLTGSRIRLPYASTSGRVDIIERDEIAMSGKQSLGALLRSMPAVSGNATSTLVSNGGNGTATVTLRGLPASNTLVLLNGRRINPDAFFGRAVDLNTLPLGLIERVEVLKDGASAVYGSDAIAGVVNVITRKDVDGLELSGYYGSSTRDDLGTSHASLLYGNAVGGFRFTLGGSYYEQDPLWSRDRALSRSADDRPKGGIDQRSSATERARIMVGDEAFILADETLDGSDASHFRPATDEDRYNYRAHTVSIVPSHRWSLTANAQLALGSVAEAFGEVLYTQTAAVNTLAPTPLFTGYESIDLTVSRDNPYNPFGVDLRDVRRRVSELPPREHETRTETLRVVLGLEGTAGRFNWQAVATNQVSESREMRRHLLRASAVQQALGPASECVAPCVPLNLFGPPGSITTEMLDFIGTDSVSHGRSEMESVGVDVDFPAFDLPAGQVQVASGIEFREERLIIEPGRLVATDDTIGGVNFGATRGSRNVWEAYAEVLVPLVADRALVERLDVSFAGRISQYSDFGRATNPKVVLEYQPVPSVVLRASYSHGFRAPSLTQLYTDGKQSFDSLNDPCAKPANLEALPGCSQASDPTLVQFLTVRNGNPALEPERARTLTTGISWIPEGIEGLSASLDLYRIRETGVVDANPQFIVNQNARNGRFEWRVERDANGNITYVHASPLNMGQRDVSGLDVALDYRFDIEHYGLFQVHLDATHIHTFEDRFDPVSPTVDQAGTFRDDASNGNGALPDWKANVSFVWSGRHWRANYNIRYVSSLEEIVPIIERQRTIDAWQTHSAQVSYLGPSTAWTRVTLGANNVLDEPPPFAAAAFNDSYDSRTYDITGRFLYLRLTKGF